VTTHLSSPVLAAVDGSPSSDRAVRWAAREAQRRRLPLRVIHVYTWPVSGYPPGLTVTAEVREALRDESLRIVRRAVHIARDEVPDVRVSSVSLCGATIPTLAAESGTAALVVSGSRDLGAVTGAVVGSVGVGLTVHSRCPVVVVRGEGELPASGPVVVGVDGSPASEAAVPFAFEAASLRGVPLVAVHVWSERFNEAAYWEGYLTVDWSPHEERARVVLAERLAGWQEKFPDVEVKRTVRRGDPARTLLRRAAGSQLLVVGTRGHGRLAGLALGSTSQALVQHAEIPVAVIRPHPAD